jgi:DHA1 family bicyclomycin/chloramphenicol resistance-like MFS transporter
MVLTGSTLTFVSAITQAVLLGSGHVSPATIFIPGFLLTFSQGLSLPFAQAGAMAIEPRLAGTASGVAVCLQNLLGAITTQVYGVIADGTVAPIAYVACASAFMTMVSGATPFFMQRKMV